MRRLKSATTWRIVRVCRTHAIELWWQTVRLGRRKDHRVGLGAATPSSPHAQALLGLLSASCPAKGQGLVSSALLRHEAIAPVEDSARGAPGAHAVCFDQAVALSPKLTGQ